MKHNLIIAFSIFTLLITGCKKGDKGGSFMSSIASSQTDFHLAKKSKLLFATNDSLNSHLKTLQSLLSANAYGAITLVRTIDGGITGASPLYNISGQINDNSASDKNYVFTISTNSRTASYSSGNGYLFSSTTSQQTDTPAYAGIYGGTKSFSLKLNSSTLFSGNIQTPKAIQLQPINILSGRDSAVIHWNTDATDSFGVVISAIAMDSTGKVKGGVYDIFSDAEGSKNIVYLLNEYPACPTFVIEIYRGNYYQTTVSGNKYIVGVLSESHSAISYLQH